jgi:DNA-binding SARP family transcriptional activator
VALYRWRSGRYNSRVEFRILGPLQVLDGGRELRLGSAKERSLLAVLLLHAGAVVSRARLIEELWGEAPPPTAGKALNVHVSQLRKTLASNGETTIMTRAPGYALEVEPDRVDAARFERLVIEARGRVAAGDVESASSLLREALSLWRGPALDGVEFEAAARNDVGRLEELRLVAQMDWIDCDLGLGLHEQLIGELEALVDAHPLRERLRGQLVLALYRSGRQADALRSYREARESLVGELGIEPSVPLQRLERAILNQDPSLEVPAGIARSVAPAPDLTGTVTIVFADAEDISRVARELPPGDFEAFATEYQQLLQTVFQERGGRVLATFFDTVSAVFPTAKQAALAAATAQRAVAALQQGLKLKVGLDAGSVAAVTATGPVALRCAQLCNEAAGGQILVSQAVASLLDNEGLQGFALRDLGERSQAGVPGGPPVRLYDLVVRTAAGTT